MVTLDKAGNEVINGFSTNLTPAQNAGMSPVPNSTIKNASVIKVPPTQTIDPNLPTINSISNNTATTLAQTDVNDSETDYNKTQNNLTSLYDQLSGKGADQIQEENNRGVPELNKNVTDLQNLARQKTLEYNLVGQTTPYSLAGQGRGISSSLLRGQEAQIQRQKQTSLAVDSLVATSSLEAARGNLKYAQDLADRAVNIKYDPIINKIDAQNKLLIENKFTLSRADQKLAAAKVVENDAKKKEIEDKKTEEKAVQGLINTAAQNGATDAQLEFLTKNVKSVDDFYAQGGGDLLAKDTTKFIEMADGSTIMVNAKTGATLKTYSANNVSSTGENENALAYARQAAVDGKLPSLTDTQKIGSSPAEIMKIAKELPKQKGEIVSTQTGIKSTGVSAPIQEDFQRLYNITQSINKLKELDAKRLPGLIGGTANFVLGGLASNLGVENSQAAYLTARKAIVDDLSRMQSGAALTLDEVAFYQEYLPGRYSEFLNLGQDSGDKIANFETQMNNKLKDGLGNNGLSIYGYSTVKASNGNEYIVGQDIEINGVKGRVLSDGQISTIKGQTPTATSSPVSVTIPASSRLASVNNNPGNLRFAGQSGATKGEGGFAKFSSPQAGVKALENQIKLDVGRGLTLSQFINKFAPPSENDTENYIKVVAKATSSSPSAKLAQIDINKLLRAIANHESGTKIS